MKAANKPQVALIYPVFEDLNHMTYWPPLGLLYLGASLRERLGGNVWLVDRNRLLGKYGDLAEVDRQTRSELSAFNPQWIGISATTLLMPDASHVASLAKLACPEARIIMGGPHPTALPEETLSECPEVEVVVIGEGEEIVIELVDGVNPAMVRGVAFREGSAVRRTDQRQPHDKLDIIPQPAWDLVDMGYYTKRSDRVIRGRELKATHLVTTRGCPFSCRFCAGSTPHPGVRYFSPRRVVEEIEHLMSHYAVEGFYFADDMFAVNAARAVDICNLLVGRGIHERLQWGAQLHSSMANREVLTLMRRAGCCRIEVGVESGSQRILTAMNKKATPEKHLSAIRLCQELGFEVFVNIILGYPGEDAEDAELTLALVHEVSPDNVSVNRFIPLPGSPIFQELKAAAQLDFDWGKYSVGNNFNFSKMEAEQLKLYEELIYNSVHFQKIASLETKASLDGRALSHRDVLQAKNQLIREQHIVIENLKRELVRLNLAWRESQEQLNPLRGQARGDHGSIDLRRDEGNS